MSQISPRLSLPYIQPAQAQKHVTHNEALRLLDSIAQLHVLAFDVDIPPASPQEGDLFAVGQTPSGAWSDFAGKLAVWNAGVWSSVVPQKGWVASSSDAELWVFDGTVWALSGLGSQNLTGLGINTSYDAVNRLAVASDATLFSHDGQGHQMKVNKAAQSDTASLLFQTDYTTHAELGLAGDNDLSIKTSADGVNFVTALAFDASTGLASGEAVQQSADDTTPGRLMRADYGYGPGNIIAAVSQAGGLPTGGIIERGENANGEFVRFADGTQFCFNFSGAALATTQANGSIYKSTNGLWTFPAAFSSVTSVSIYAASDNVANWAVARPLGASSARYRQYAAAYSATLFSTRLFAVGVWF